MTAYYNDNDPFCAQWLRNLIAAGLLPAGTVDERDIRDVRGADLDGFTQCHFFAGIGGWPYALRLAGWPDDVPVWTGSVPCQPVSCAGKRKGEKDVRHLWPEFYRLIAERRPGVVFGEQVASNDGYEWLDGVSLDLERIGYGVGSCDLPVACVGAPHRRQRLWWVADTKGFNRWNIRDDSGNGERWQGGTFADASCSRLANASNADRRAGERESQTGVGPDRERRERSGECGEDGGMENPTRTKSVRQRQQQHKLSGPTDFWSDSILIPCADGKARRVKPGLQLLAHGVPGRVGKLRGFGNAIVPQVAAKFVRAFMETTDYAELAKKRLGVE